MQQMPWPGLYAPVVRFATAEPDLFVDMGGQGYRNRRAPKTFGAALRKKCIYSSFHREAVRPPLPPGRDESQGKSRLIKPDQTMPNIAKSSKDAFLSTILCDLNRVILTEFMYARARPSTRVGEWIWPMPRSVPFAPI